MKNSKSYRSKIVIVCVLVTMTISIQKSLAQGVSVYQYRKVQDDKVAEFIERETTYWSKVAQKAIDDGKLQFWGLFQKMGGYDLDNTSNFLFINTFTDIDNTEGVWDAATVFPDVAIEDMETYSMSKNTSVIFVKSQHWTQAANANPENDFKYITMVYHNANNPAGLITAENEVWAPFIKSAMDEGKTTQKAWGNALILSPTGEDINYNTISFDIYPSLKEALDPTWDESLEAPDMTKIGEAEGNRRGSVVYRAVKVVDANQ
jgi:hypothetical protein